MQKRKTFALRNMFGGINSTAEENALASFDTKGAGFGAEARDIENWAPINRGGQSKAFGFSLHKACGTGTVTGLYRYVKANGTSYFLVSHANDLYSLSGGTLTPIGSNPLTNNAYTHFETASNEVVVCDGTIIPRRWDGTTLNALTANTEATGAKQTLFYQNKLFLFGNTSNPSLLYFSKAGDITLGYDGTSAPDGGFVACDVNDGEKITAIAKYFIPGNLTPVIIVAKERSIGIVTGSGTTTEPYTFQKINIDAGMNSFRAIVQFDQDVAYLTSKGVSSYRTDVQNINLLYSFLSEKVRDKFTALSTNQTGAIAWYDRNNARIGFAVAESGQTVPNVIWFYDIRLNCWWKERWASGQDCTACFIDTDGTWYHGDSSGNVHIHAKTTTTFSSSAIQATYKTGFMDFGAPGSFKEIKCGRIVLRGNGAYPLSITPVYDYGARTGRSITVDTKAAYTWNGGVWTADPSTYQWGGGSLVERKFYPTGQFKTLQLVITQFGASQPVEIFDIEFDVEYHSLT